MKYGTGFWLQCGGMMVVVTMAARPVEAQAIRPWDDRGFVNVSVGAQPTGRTHVAAGEFDLYDESGTFDASLQTGASSIFDIQTGVRVWNNALVALAYTRYSDSVGALVHARVPDPLFVDTFAEATADVGGLRHREQAVHMSVGYMVLVPGLDGMRLLFHAGPTAFSLNKDVVSGVTVVPGTQVVDGVTVENVSSSALGAHFGADAQYMINSRLGAGLLIRWAAGSVDMPQIEGGKVKVGGLTVGVGVRYVF